MSSVSPVCWLNLMSFTFISSYNSAIDKITLFTQTNFGETSVVALYQRARAPVGVDGMWSPASFYGLHERNKLGRW